MRDYAPFDATQVRALQVRYAQAYPGAAVISREVYSHPAFEGGRNIRCAFDQQGNLVGYAPMFPQPMFEGQIAAPHVIWVEIKADPAIEEPVVLKDALWGWVLRRAREIKEALPPRPVELRFEYLSSETASLDYVRAKGFVHYRSVFKMARDLTAPILDLPLPSGVTARSWKMGTEAESPRGCFTCAEAHSPRRTCRWMSTTPVPWRSTSGWAISAGSRPCFWRSGSGRGGGSGRARLAPTLSWPVSPPRRELPFGRGHSRQRPPGSALATVGARRRYRPGTSACHAPPR